MRFQSEPVTKFDSKAYKYKRKRRYETSTAWKFVTSVLQEAFEEEARGLMFICRNGNSFHKTGHK